jgi:hypothetical protein
VSCCGGGVLQPCAWQLSARQTLAAQAACSFAAAECQKPSAAAEHGLQTVTVVTDTSLRRRPQAQAVSTAQLQYRHPLRCRGNLYTGSSVSAAARLHISTAAAARRQGCVLAAADGGLGAVAPLVSALLESPLGTPPCTRCMLALCAAG